MFVRVFKILQKFYTLKITISAVQKKMSKKPTNYKNPPVVEAIIEIRTTLKKEHSFHDLELISKKYGDIFKERKKIYLTRTGFDIENVATTSSFHSIGYELHNDKECLQIFLDKYVYILKGNYSEWEDFVAGAKKYWKFYKDLLKPEKPVRIGVRFVNLITLPKKSGNLDDYFETMPVISEKIGKPIADFNMEVVIPNIEDNIHGKIKEVFYPVSENKNQPEIIFDVDVFTEDLKDLHETRLWNKFKTLRKVKNFLFESSIKNELKVKYDKR